MLFVTIVKIALKSLFANKLRSALAMLGIIIGVGAVVATLAMGAGAQKQVLDNISAMGTDLLVVRPGNRGTGGVISGTTQNLTLEDAETILTGVEGVRQVAPVVSDSNQIKYMGRNARINVIGTTPTYLTIRNFEVEHGRMFNENESEGMAHVTVIGPATAETLFVGEDPIGSVIKLKGLNFRIIGVTKSKGDQGWFNPDDVAIVPYTTAMNQLFGLDYLREIDIQANPGGDLDELQVKVTEFLRRRHRLLADMPDDFYIRNQAEIIQTASSVSRTFTILLGAVGGISLLVGGIGIMNIMLVTVTERTREIGIRKAIGAKNRDILRQFLLEAVVMSALGGLIGAMAGAGSAKIIGAMTQFATVVQPQSVIMAVSVAAAVGVFFGYYPASRAANLNPIDALRYE